MFKWILSICFALLMILAPVYAAGKFYVIQSQANVGPAIADLVKRSLAKASNEPESALVLALKNQNTATKSSIQINKAIMNATIPVILLEPNASNLNDQELLKLIAKRKVNVNGQIKELNTQGAKVIRVPTDWRYNLIDTITNPNVLYVLILIALYGLFFEMANPGLIFPGVLGFLALLTVLYALQLVPINYAGFTLLLVGIALMVFEVYVSSFGLIGLGGIIAFILGSIMLFITHDSHVYLAWPLILSMSVLTAAFFFLLLTIIFRSQKKSIVTGAEGLIGNTAIVITVMNQQVTVRVLGELWDARSTSPVNQGDKVKVVGIQNLSLVVEPLKNNNLRNT